MSDKAVKAAHVEGLYVKTRFQGGRSDDLELRTLADTGNHLPKDEKKAVEYYRAAIGKGNVSAINSLGLCHMNGIGVKQDPNEAVRLFREAADKGNADAIRSLGLCYENGIGVKQDPNEAVRLFREAADKGNADAINYLKNRK